MAIAAPACTRLYIYVVPKQEKRRLNRYGLDPRIYSSTYAQLIGREGPRFTPMVNCMYQRRLAPRLPLITDRKRLGPSTDLEILRFRAPLP